MIFYYLQSDPNMIATACAKEGERTFLAVSQLVCQYPPLPLFAAPPGILLRWWTSERVGGSIAVRAQAAARDRRG